jgi:hypothetical protein
MTGQPTWIRGSRRPGPAEKRAAGQPAGRSRKNGYANGQFVCQLEGCFHHWQLSRSADASLPAWTIMMAGIANHADGRDVAPSAGRPV